MSKKDFLIGIIATIVILFVSTQILFPPDYLCSSYPQPFYTDIPKLLVLAIIIFIVLGFVMSLDRFRDIIIDKKKVKNS